MAKFRDRLRLHAFNLMKVLFVRSERGPIVRRYAFDAARQVTPAIVASAGAHTYLLSTADKSLGRATFSAGEYEMNVMRSAVDLIAEEMGQDPVRGKVFLDIGANVGTTSVPAAAGWGASRVIAVEPSPDNLKLLRCNVILNDVDDLVTCVHGAISTAGGSVALELSDSNSGDHRVRVSDEGGDYGEAARTTVTVPSFGLDELLQILGMEQSAVGLMWVDTQGHEGQVLASATGLLAAGCPAVIEYWPYGLERAGGLEILHSVIESSFTTVIDVRTGSRYSSAEMARVADAYTGHTYTDLALIP
jgi:FkbM family methyltransferase